MNPEELAALKAELEAFKATIPQLKDLESLKTAQTLFIADITAKYGELDKSAEIAKLTEAITKQGETITALKLQGESGKTKSFRDTLVENKDKFAGMIDGTIKQLTFTTTQKAVTSANVTGSTLSYREAGVGQIQRGMPFMADLFPRIVLGSNNGGTVRWSEQTAVTNSAGVIAEATKPTVESNLTWGEKTLGGKRIVDFIKVGLDEMKDVDYVLGEVQALINKNMKLKENDQLINGDGNGNNMNGLLSYATDFVVSDDKIIDPNLVDLVNRAGLQIVMDMKGGAAATNFVASPVDIQPLKEAKDSTGRYIFERWALGENPSFGGTSYVRNPLVASDTLVIGDFNMATLFVFDELTIQMVRTDDDEIKRMVTIFAYMRENLRVKEVDQKAFVKVASIKDTLSAMKVNPLG